eukprot:PITA_29425
MGFQAFNQIVVHPDDQEKTAFTTTWGTFMYAKMPFGLMNVGATFQRAMDIAFVGEKDKFVLIYLDDITIYSSSHHDHLQHLKKVFLKCRKFGISVNPKKSQFALEEGRLLGHIVSVAGVCIDPERVKAIQTLTVPRSKKDIQSFLGKINFVRRFIPNFVELVKHITSMLRKGVEVKWTETARKYFESIKKAIMEAPTLISPDYSKEFHLFSFASEDTIAAVLLQQDEEGSENPVAFFSKNLRDVELRAKWIAKMIEFNIDLKPTKLVRGQGLAKLLTKENYRSLDLDSLCTIAANSQTNEEGRVTEIERKHSVAENLAACNWWILVATDYFTKWIEAVPTRKADHTMVMKFLTENIFTIFGCPHKLITDNVAAFRAKELVEMCDSMGIKLVHSTSYYPQGNGLVESSNKSLIKIIKKLLEENKRNWDSKLKYALWADRVTIKRSTGSSPFKLVYKTEGIFPIQLTLPVEKFLQEEQNEEEDMANRITDLIELHQIREQLVEKVAAYQRSIKEAFDKKAKRNNFQIGDLVLKWDALKEKKGNHGKFDALWTGPFIISQVQRNNTFMLKSMGGETVFDGPVNGRFLKDYVV